MNLVFAVTIAVWYLVSTWCWPYCARVIRGKKLHLGNSTCSIGSKWQCIQHVCMRSIREVKKIVIMIPKILINVLKRENMPQSVKAMTPAASLRSMKWNQCMRLMWVYDPLCMWSSRLGRKVSPSKVGRSVVALEKCVHPVDIAHVVLHACDKRRSATKLWCKVMGCDTCQRGSSAQPRGCDPWMPWHR